MNDYRVIFFNNLVNCYGKPFKCLQRAIAVMAEDAAGAAETAKREFERLEHVPNWTCHAQFLEVESRPFPERGSEKVTEEAARI
jgi:hypothetical protein